MIVPIVQTTVRQQFDGPGSGENQDAEDAFKDLANVSGSDLMFDWLIDV